LIVLGLFCQYRSQAITWGYPS